MKGNGVVTKNKGSEFIFTAMGRSMKESGKTGKEMAKASILGKMETNMRGNLRKG